MQINSLLHEDVAVAAALAETTVNTGASDVDSAVVQANNFGQLTALVAVGATAAAADLVLSIYQSTDAAKTGAKTVKTVTVSGGAAANSEHLFTVRREDFDTNGGFGYAFIRMTQADAGGTVLTALLLGSGGPQHPQSIHNESGAVVYP